MASKRDLGEKSTRFTKKKKKHFFFYYIFGCDPTQQSLQTKLKVYEFANVQKNLHYCENRNLHSKIINNFIYNSL